MKAPELMLHTEAMVKGTKMGMVYPSLGGGVGTES